MQWNLRRFNVNATSVYGLFKAIIHFVQTKTFNQFQNVYMKVVDVKK